MKGITGFNPELSATSSTYNAVKLKHGFDEVYEP